MSGFLASNKQKVGAVTVATVSSSLNWPALRAEHVLNVLVQDSTCWIDTQTEPTEYYVAGLFI